MSDTGPSHATSAVTLVICIASLSATLWIASSSGANHGLYSDDSGSALSIDTSRDPPDTPRAPR